MLAIESGIARDASTVAEMKKNILDELLLRLGGSRARIRSVSVEHRHPMTGLDSTVHLELIMSTPLHLSSHDIFILPI